jgi:hypothetical protein
MKVTALEGAAGELTANAVAPGWMYTVIALSHLFSCVAGEVGGTELKEPMELVNGSPCAAAMLADCALRRSGDRRTRAGARGRLAPR